VSTASSTFGARWRRVRSGPAAATIAMAGMAAAGVVGTVVPELRGQVLTWLALGLTAGYALSGSV
jgi:hypothetical protein